MSAMEPKKWQVDTYLDHQSALQVTDLEILGITSIASVEGSRKH